MVKIKSFKKYSAVTNNIEEKITFFKFVIFIDLAIPKIKNWKWVVSEIIQIFQLYFFDKKILFNSNKNNTEIFNLCNVEHSLNT